MAHLRLNKFLVILMSPENKMWKRLFTTPKQSSIHTVTGVSSSTLSNWRRGQPAADGVVEKISADILKCFEPPLKERKGLSKEELEKLRADKIAYDARLKLLGLTDDFLVQSKKISEDLLAFHKLRCGDKPYSEDTEKVAEFFGMEPNECRAIIDEAIYLVFPLLPGMYYEAPRDEARADEAIQTFKGRYMAWMRRGGRWLGAALEVRYKIKVGNGWAIRCKMNVPTVYKTEYNFRETWAYDGFLMLQPASFFWIFEMRDQKDADYIFMITKAAREVSEKLVMAGTYLTTGQGVGHPIRSDQLLLERLTNANTPADELKDLPTLATAWRTMEPGAPLTKEIQEIYDKATKPVDLRSPD